MNDPAYGDWGDLMEKNTVELLFNNYYHLFPNSSSIAIANVSEFIYYQPSLDIDLKIKQGDPVTPETVTYKAIKERRRVMEYKDESIFGVPYYAISQPIIRQKKLLGAMTAIFPQKPQMLSAPYLTVKQDDRWVPIYLDEVIYLEAQNRKTNVTAVHTEGTHRFNLTELEQNLPKNTFIRCHRSYIINIHHIKEIHPDVHSTFILVMTDDSRVPVSQSYAKHVREILGF
mgnify:CR=1 FL=1